MNGDSTVTLMLQFDDYGALFTPTTIKLVYTSNEFSVISKKYIDAYKSHLK